MSLSAIIRKDVQDSVRSGVLLAITLLFVLVAGFWAAIQHVPPIYGESDIPTSTLALLNSMGQPMAFFVPLLGLGIAYNSIVGERESGSIKLALGLPNSRRDIVFGKFIGRSIVLAVAILTAFLVVAVIALLTYESFAAVEFVLYTVMTVFYGLVYVAIGIGFSSTVNSQPTALAGATGLYVLFQLGWDAVTAVLQTVTVGWVPPESGPPDWVVLVYVLNPTAAMEYATQAIIPEFDAITAYPASDAFYLQDWVGFPILAAWLLLPLGFGYRTFARMEIR